MPRSPGAGRKRTSPSLGRDAPSTDCQRCPEPGRSSTTRVSHSKSRPERAPDLPVHAAVARGRHLGEPGCDPRQGLRIAPEAVELLGGLADRDRGHRLRGVLRGPGRRPAVSGGIDPERLVEMAVPGGGPVDEPAAEGGHRRPAERTPAEPEQEQRPAEGRRGDALGLADVGLRRPSTRLPLGRGAESCPSSREVPETSHSSTPCLLLPTGRPGRPAIHWCQVGHIDASPPGPWGIDCARESRRLPGSISESAAPARRRS